MVKEENMQQVIYNPLVLLHYLLILFNIFIGTKIMFHFCSNC